MATTYALSMKSEEVERRATARQPMYGGFESSQWSSDANRATANQQSVRSNSSIPLSHQAQPLQQLQSPYAEDGADAYQPPPYTNKLIMKGRPRGESDLGRAGHRSNGQKEQASSLLRQRGVSLSALAETEHPSWKIEALTIALVSLPFLISSQLYPPKSLFISSNVVEKDASVPASEPDRASAVLQAMAIASATLLIMAAIGRTRLTDNRSSRRKSDSGDKLDRLSYLSLGAFKIMTLRMLCVFYPLFAVIDLGGTRTALIMLVALAAGIISPEALSPDKTKMKSWRSTLWDRKWTCLTFALCLTVDLIWKDPTADYVPIIRGYMILIKTVVFLQPPLPTLFYDFSKMSAFQAKSKSSGRSAAPNVIPGPAAVSVLIASPEDTQFTAVAGASLLYLVIGLSTVLGVRLSLSFASIGLFMASSTAAAGLLGFSRALSLRTHRKFGLGLGTLLIVSIGWMHDFHTLKSAIALGICACCSYIAVHFDTPIQPAKHHHETSHSNHSHQHHHHHEPTDGSRFTRVLLHYTENWPLIHSILASKDSRSIFYFLCINFGFMLIQLFYSIVSESLGLLSDSIHMFFDCFGMLVGLFAAVMTKWPASDRFPYGFGKVNTLSGFANGVFLIFVSIEFIWDSFERFFDGVQLKRVEELFVVSVLGLIVNLIGLKLTHGNHGHDHGHSHAHEDKTHHEGNDITVPQPTSHSHHNHHHHDENMLGIYLHILADTMGSVAVIISTALTYATGYSFWDPLASCIIAVLIIAASYPLVRDSSKKLLLTVPSDVEWKLREALQELSGLRGVSRYAGSRFWVDDSDAGGGLHGHACAHSHEHDHSHIHPGGLDGHGEHAESKGTGGAAKIFGVIHVFASRGADLEDVRMRTCEFLAERNMDVVVHVERDTDRRWYFDG